MKFTKLLVIILIISLVLVVGCNKQAAKKESAVNNEAPAETAPETSGIPAQEPVQEQVQETTTGTADVGVSDQELADLKNELNEDVVEDVDTTAFQ